VKLMMPVSKVTFPQLWEDLIDPDLTSEEYAKKLLQLEENMMFYTNAITQIRKLLKQPGDPNASTTKSIDKYIEGIAKKIQNNSLSKTSEVSLAQSLVSSWDDFLTIRVVKVKKPRAKEKLLPKANLLVQ
jgi:hypothetical protein